MIFFLFPSAASHGAETLIILRVPSVCVYMYIPCSLTRSLALSHTHIQLTLTTLPLLHTTPDPHVYKIILA